VKSAIGTIHAILLLASTNGSAAEKPNIDLTPILSGKAKPARERPMIWEFHGYGGTLAVTDGPWKAVRRKVMSRKPGEWEFHQLDSDPAESDDLATDPSMTGRKKALFARFRELQERYDDKLDLESVFPEPY
jgi:hypothetical protein